MDRVKYAVYTGGDTIEVICDTLADAEEYCLAWCESNLYESCHWDLHYWDLTETMEENISNLWDYVRETCRVHNLLFWYSLDLDIVEVPCYG